MSARFGWRGLAGLRRFLTGTTRKTAMETELSVKMNQQVQLLRADVIKYIDSERHGVANSPLTVLVKGSSRPLVDRGDLRASVNGRVDREGGLLTGAVGVLRRSRSRKGGKMTNIAAALHDGYVVRVTPKVRAAVFAEMRRRRGRKKTSAAGAHASGTGSRTWKVKGRPFIEAPFDEAIPRIKAALGDAVLLSLRRNP